MTAQRIVIPSTAFSKVPSKQRKPRERNEQHLKFIRTLKCCICGAQSRPGAYPSGEPVAWQAGDGRLGEGFR
jgi:hypothetical protein